MFVPVSWGIPPAKISVPRGLEEFEAEALRAIGAFRATNNFFRFGETRGLLLDPHLPLDLDSTYWLLTQLKLQGRPPLGLDVVEERAPLGWHKYKITLPGSSIFDRSVEHLERYLQRRICPKYQRATLQFPPALIIDPDGTPVLGLATEFLLLRWPSAVPLAASGSAAAHVVVVPWKDPAYVVVRGMVAGELCLSDMQGERFTARLRDVLPYRPRGVRIVDDLEQCELFEKKSIDMLRRETIRHLEVPNTRVWKLVRVDGKVLASPPSDTKLDLGLGVLAIDAGSFGEIRQETVVPQGKRTPVEEGPRANVGHTALSNIVASHAGTVAAYEFAQLRTNDECWLWSRRHQLDWLLPYAINLLNEHQHNALSVDQ